MSTTFALRPRDLALAFGGLAGCGAAIGFAHGPLVLVQGALALPAVIAGVGLLMLPALYIATAMTGAAPPLPSLLEKLVHSVRDCGLLLLGLVPTLLFLGATSAHPASLGWLSFGAIALAALVGLRALGGRLLAKGAITNAHVAFWLWALVALGLGVRLLDLTVLR